LLQLKLDRVKEEEPRRTTTAKWLVGSHGHSVERADMVKEKSISDQKVIKN
jgi:hypothetical protein